MLLEEIFSKETVVAELESTEKDELFEELVEKIHSFCPEFDRRQAVESLNEREAKMSTGIMHAVAVPHALIPSMGRTVGAIGVSRGGIDYDALDKSPVNVVFLIIGRDGDAAGHIRVLRELALVLQSKGFVEGILKCRGASEIYNFVCNAERSIS